MDQLSSQENTEPDFVSSDPELFNETQNHTPESESQIGKPTQPIESDTISQSVLNYCYEVEKPWGYLMHSHLQRSSIPLTDDQRIVGREQFNKSLLGRHYEQTSRQHFRIIRMWDGQGQYIVNIEDLSAWGTFVNSVLVGKNNKRPLFHRDKISVVHQVIEVFEFFDRQYGRSVPGIPNEITSNYTLMGDLIDKGGFGNVYQVMKHSTTERLAMKVIELKPYQLDDRFQTGGSPLDEANIMYKIRHINIVRIHETYCIGTTLFIFMEFIPGGNLYHYVNDRQTYLSEIQAKFIFYQLVNAIAYLHDHKIVHRDIKPLNVLCSKKEINFPIIKLTDFGTSRFLNKDIEHVHTFCGTKLFAAPEINTLFFTNPQAKEFDARCDVWSLALIFYFCLSNDFPFKSGDNKPSLEYQIREWDVKFTPIDAWRPVSPEAKELILCMMAKNFLKRPTSQKLLQKQYFVDDARLQRSYSRLVHNDQKRNLDEAIQDENDPKKIPRFN